jgi:acetyltransferase-like isoleucine patch superfamily enzyme
MIKKIFRRIKTILLEFDVMILHLIGDNVPSHHIRRFFCRLAGLRIGEGSTLHMGIRFYDPTGITIGKDSIIGEGSVLDGRDKLTIGNHVDIATEVMIYNAEHDTKDPGFRPISAPVTIQDYVFIGPRAIILPGVTIKKGAVVGAGAVVTKDVEEGSIVAGVPAKQIGTREIKNLNYKLGRAAWFR